jgi:integrase
MQNGSVIRAERQRGPDVWGFRWREPGADGKRRHRRIVLGSVEQLADETAARQAISALRLEFNRGGAWLKTRSASVSDLVSHYRERELDPDTVWKTHSTKVTYEGYLNKWILPRWESYPLVRVNAGEVELWLRSLPLARSSCAKIRNLMSVVFNHGMRHEICGRNPHRLAHLLTHVFFIVEGKQNRHQSNARIASSCVEPGHVGHVYPGHHSTKAASSEQRHSSSAGVYSSCRLRPG